jgi:endonuclease/exonuclease/phosphatase (EEP) superfamily protein YafD
LHLTAGVARLFVFAFASFLVGGTILSFLPSKKWWIRVFDFPRRQLAVLLFLCAVASVAFVDTAPVSARIVITVVVAALCTQVVRTLPYTRLTRPQVPRANRCEEPWRLRLLVSNIEYDNKNTAALLQLVREVKPDIVLLLEPGRWWESQMTPLERDFPYVVRQPQEDSWGLLLYSRFELIDPEIRFLVEPDIPSVRTRVRLPSGRDVWLYAVHPRPPRPGDDTEERDTELIVVAREIEALGDAAVLAGDLNDVAWSRTTLRLLRTSGLKDPRVGRGTFATFSADLPAGFRWPLDHVFLTPHWALCRIQCLRKIGSDHLPLFAEIVLKDAARQTPDTRR